MGLACTLLIYLWVKDEYRVDKFFAKDSQLYQVIKTSRNADATIHTHETTPGQLARLMGDEIPEIEYAVSVVSQNNGILSDDKKFIKAKPLFAGRDFFNVFSYRLIEGNAEQVLADKSSVVISDKMALRLFNSTREVIGKSLSWEGEDFTGTFSVSGVFESPPVNATRQMDVVFSYQFYFDMFKDRYGLDRWNSNNPSTYLILREGTDIKAFNEKIKDFSWQKYKLVHGNVDQWEGKIYARQYSDKYLNNVYDENGQLAGGRIEYVRIFSIIAVFILLIACINFMNLSTARASRRMKEVGIKKTVGAGRATLITQYLGESMIMSLLSLVVGLFLVWLLLPQFNLITGKHLTLTFDTNILIALVCVTMVTGLLAGSYPAFYLSAFNPVYILKGRLVNLSRGWGEALARRGLVVFQFTMSIILIVSVVVVYNQVKYIQAKNLGYDKENVIIFPAEGKLRNNLSSFLQQVKAIPGVVNASVMQGNLVGQHSGGGGIGWPGKAEGQGIEFDGLDVGYDLATLLDLKMKEGRFFSPEFTNEKEKVIFNQAAVEAMNLKDPVGQTVVMWGVEKQIIGIAEDFHFESLYKKVGPFFFRFSEEEGNVLVKLKAGSEQETLRKLEKFYQAYNVGLPFEYHFLEEEYDTLYASEQRVGTLSRYFAGIAILISCLGLFGLASYTAERRIKEIGIRKVLGSSQAGIIYLLSGDFTKMVLLAILVAIPLSYHVVKNWLDGFAYRIDLEPVYFAGAALTALLVAWLTVGIQTFKASRVNPTQCLRSE